MHYKGVFFKEEPILDDVCYNMSEIQSYLFWYLQTIIKTIIVWFCNDTVTMSSEASIGASATYD